MGLKIGQFVLYQKNIKELGEIVFEENYFSDYPSLLIFEEDIIWKHPFTAWGIEDWDKNVYKTLLFTIVSLLLKKFINIKVFEKEHLLINRPITKYLYFTIVGAEKGNSHDLLENDILEFIKAKSSKVSDQEFLRKLLRHITSRIGSTYQPGREYLKRLVKRYTETGDCIEVVSNPNSFKYKEDFTVVINEKYKSKVSSDYIRLKEIIEEQCSLNYYFSQFCEELELCNEKIMRDISPDYN